MKTIIFFFFLSSNFFSSAQISEALNGDDYFHGKYYIVEVGMGRDMMIQGKMDEDSIQFILRIIPAKFDSTIVSINLDSIPEEKIADNEIRWEVKPPYIDYSRYTYYEKCLSVEPELGKGVCIQKTKHQTSFTTIHLDSIHESYLSIKEYYLISDGRLEIERVKEQPSTLRENELYFPNKIWSIFTPVLCCKMSGPTVYEIEQRLVVLGYQSNLNGKIEEIEKESLTQFQKDNNLETGNLNAATLKALGLNY